MSRFLAIHPDNPQPRRIRQAADLLDQGEVIVYPTDSSYALGCRLGDKGAIDHIRRIRGLDSRHNLTLVCLDLSEIATYAKVSNSAYRLLKSLTPGPYTFILKATHEVPRRLQHPRRKTVGIRVPANPIARALLEAVGRPIMSSTLILPGRDRPESDPEEIRERLGRQVGLVIDGGSGGTEPTTVIDLTGEAPEVVRAGLGPVDGLV